MQTVSIDIVSDVVCPWCYLGKARLDQAIANVGSEVQVAVQWRPYQLNPDLPPEGVDHKQHLAAKLGGQAAVDRAHETLNALGNADGIAFDFDAVKISPNTLDAHRLIRWAATNGEAAQSAVVGLLFKANFEEGRNVGDQSVLLDIATEAGLDRPVIAALLNSDADKDAVREEIGMAREMGVTGVPCFILDGQYAVMGAQSVDVLSNALREIAQMKATA
ncbi:MULTISPECIES: DsbA family oxidoreductase [unclassified Ensifer]|uniref:DsbA family oxidoreductase n=1 Tax=unclassified Ensifer TaxID=2633371 RepID=UPI000812CA69|nr:MULTISPECIES: DsbA family oxidoreductase [unclassified Ensifer]OCP24228.1 disulfide bond formation protein DsbA [Ensifer sp. LC384]OCP25662.1 disulfide bond formation protein DsbA [Ensifer sp. LC54]